MWGLVTGRETLSHTNTQSKLHAILDIMQTAVHGPVLERNLTLARENDNPFLRDIVWSSEMHNRAVRYSEPPFYPLEFELVNKEGDAVAKYVNKIDISSGIILILLGAYERNYKGYCW